MKRELLITSVTVLLLLAPMGLSAEGNTTNEANDTYADQDRPGRDDAVAIDVEPAQAEVPNATDAGSEGVTDDLNTWVDETGDRMTGDLRMGTNGVFLNGRELASTGSGTLTFDGVKVCLENTGCVVPSMTGQMPIEVIGNTIRLSTDGCTIGDVWKWDGTVWACDPDEDTDTDTLAALSCANGEIAEFDGSAWVCASDDDTTYGGADFAISGQSCPAGEVATGVDATGQLTCAVDQDTDTDTTYTAGDGLDLAGTEFNLIGCTDGQVLKVSGTSWTCGIDEDTDTQVSTLDWSDVTNKPAGFADDVDDDTQLTEAEVDAFVDNNGYLTSETDPTVNALAQATLTCATDQLAKYDGTAWTCAEDVDTDTDTTYTAGDGLDLAGTQFNIVACSDGQVLKVSGTSWACGTDDNSQLSTLPWSDVTDKPTGFADDVDDDVLGALSCTSDQVAKYDGTAWTCAEDVDTDTDTTYTAGDGLDLTGTEFSLPVCGDQEILRFHSLVDEGDPNWMCTDDDDTKYTAGQGLELTATEFSLLTCDVGRILKMNPGDGGGPFWGCATDADTDTTYTAGDALTLSGTEFSLSPCLDGEILEYDGTSSAWTCGSDDAGSSDADTLDGLDSAAFLRSDADDTYSSGTLTLADGTTLDVDGQLIVGEADSSTDSIKFNGGEDNVWFGYYAAQDQMRSSRPLLINGNLHVVGEDGTDDDRIIFDSAGTQLVQFAWIDLWDAFLLTHGLATQETIATSTVGKPFSYNRMGDAVDHSGEMDAGGDLAVAEDLEVDGSAFLSGSLYMEGRTGTSGDGDQTIYFYETGNRQGEQFGWSDGAARFEFSDDLAFGDGTDQVALASNSFDDLVLARDQSDDDTDWLRVYSGGFEQLRILGGDEASANFDGAVNANGLDLAELYTNPAGAEPGDVVALDPVVPGGVRPTTQAGDARAIGVVSTDPGLVLSPFGVATEAELEQVLGTEALSKYHAQKPELIAELVAEHPALGTSPEGQQRLDALALDAYLEEQYAAVALAGRVPVKATTENGPIQPGDLLTASSQPGVAMRADGGAVIGTALSGLADGTGEVLVFVNPGWYGEGDTALLDRVTQLEQENQDLEDRLSALESLIDQHLEDDHQ